MNLIKYLVILFLHRLTFTTNILEVFAHLNLFSSTSSSQMSLRINDEGINTTFRARGGKMPHEPLKLMK